MVPAGTTPLVTFAGVAVNASPLQIVAVITVIEGFGLTVTVTVNVGPVQLPDVGVTVYIAACGEFVVFISAPLTDAAPLPGAPPVKPDPDGGDHVYVVPTGTIPLVILTGVTENPASLHTELIIGTIAGFGFTVTVTVKFVPVQLPAAGVTVYTAVCVVFVGLVSVPLMLAPEPATPPVSPPVTTGAAQLYVMPGGTIPLVIFTGVMVNALSLQTIEEIGVMAGLGFTVTSIVKSAPVQLPEVGVIVYIAVCAEFVGFMRVILIVWPLLAIPPVRPPVTVGAPHT